MQKMVWTSEETSLKRQKATCPQRSKFTELSSAAIREGESVSNIPWFIWFLNLDQTKSVWYNFMIVTRYSDQWTWNCCSRSHTLYSWLECGIIYIINIIIIIIIIIIIHYLTKYDYIQPKAALLKG